MLKPGNQTDSVWDQGCTVGSKMFCYGFQQIVRATLYIWIPGLVLCMESKRKKENIKCLQTEFILHSGLLGNVLQSAARCQIHDRKIFCIASAYWCSRQYRARSRGLDRWCEHNASLDPCTAEHKPKCGMQNILKQCLSHFSVLVLKNRKRKRNCISNDRLASHFQQFLVLSSLGICPSSAALVLVLFSPK